MTTNQPTPYHKPPSSSSALFLTNLSTDMHDEIADFLTLHSNVMFFSTSRSIRRAGTAENKSETFRKIIVRSHPEVANLLETKPQNTSLLFRVKSIYCDLIRPARPQQKTEDLSSYNFFFRIDRKTTTTGWNTLDATQENDSLRLEFPAAVAIATARPTAEAMVNMGFGEVEVIVTDAEGRTGLLMHSTSFNNEEWGYDDEDEGVPPFDVPPFDQCAIYEIPQKPSPYEYTGNEKHAEYLSQNIISQLMVEEFEGEEEDGLLCKPVAMVLLLDAQVYSNPCAGDHQRDFEEFIKMLGAITRGGVEVSESPRYVRTSTPCED